MTPLNFAAYVRKKTRTDSTTFPDSDILLYMNLFKDDIAKEIIKGNEDYFGVPETANLVADQREYPLPTDMLNQIKYVEVKLDGTNWITLKEFDLTDYDRTTDETTITSLFSNNQDNCFFDIFRGSLWIYSGTITSVSAGLKLWSFEWPADFTDLSLTNDMSIDPSNTASGFPRPFHELLARRVIIEFKTSSDRQVQLTEHELNYKADFQEAIESITGQNLNRSNTASIPKAQHTWDNGYEL